MVALNINTYYGCSSCEAADEHGNGCKYGLMFPVLLAMTNASKCPNYKFLEKSFGSTQ